MTGTVSSSQELIQPMDVIDQYSYLDLEVDSEDTIYRYGLVATQLALDARPHQAEPIHCHLLQVCQTREILCGHHIRRFDYPRLLRQWPDLGSLLIIDTLELSVLAFPLHPSHRLQKDYKLSQYASNNPLEDAQATRSLLQTSLTALGEHPESLQQAYSWLLTCGDEAADRAYQHLFDSLGWSIVIPPALHSLPEVAVAEMNLAYLETLWPILSQRPSSLCFDDRLILAALLSWNYHRHQTTSRQSYSPWLTYLPSFHRILNHIFPLIPEGFTYHPYLQEFGINQFRSFQEEAVQAILSNQYPLILMPTGGGKSLCYQLPALMFYRRQQQLTVCVSPLQALMEDQVSELEARGFEFATFINGNLSALERSQRLEAVRDGQKGLLYMGPEQLRSISIRALLRERPPVLWVIDEAHCVSQWGHDFRPDYRYIPRFIQELYAERQLAFPYLALLTATATAQVQNDIQQLFAQSGLEIRHTIYAGVQRDNLAYQVLPIQGDKTQAMVSSVQEALNQGGAALIYTTTRKSAEQLAASLQRHSIQARYYHGKLSRTEKDEVLRAFRQQELNVVTATCAFGMGINRPDVRAVIHHTISSSLEAYTQEAGRAGRDGEDATCTLLFDGQDADTIFFLKSLNQLSVTDLRNIFLAVRGVRDRLQRGERVSEEYFWVTADELFQTSDLDERFASEVDQRDTKIKVALHHLETFQLIERAENLTRFVQFHLTCSTPLESCQRFEQYSREQHLAEGQMLQFEKLIQAMHLAKAHSQQQEDAFPLDRLSDASGFPVQELSSRIRELQRAEVCSYRIPITLLITKGVRGDARSRHDQLRELEQSLLEELLELMGDRPSLQLNLRGLAARFDPDGTRKIRASMLMDILEGWRSLRWVQLRSLSNGLVQLEELQAIDWLSLHQTRSRALLDAIYTSLGQQTGTRIQLEYDLGQLLQEVNQRTQPLQWEDTDLQRMLLWLHQREILRLTEGLNLFYQALKLRVFRGANIRTVNRRYPELQRHYDEQAYRTHLMIEYGRLTSDAERQQLLQDYFSLSPEGFATTYPHLASEECYRPVTQDDYTRIMGPLNPAQQQIVESEHSALGIIAGPGSGKTRTIVHRIAYLIKVKRVSPDRILVLAYNRNAVHELRLRLQDLIGSLATHLRVFTFHGLALSLLGRTLGQNSSIRRQNEVTFEQLLRDACALLEPGDDLDDDTQLRRIQLLGQVEYIFVDEYQDVAADEYRLIQLIAGLGQSEDETRSVQINLCVVGDDDQNIFEFRGTSLRYIAQFETEYQAQRLLLIENYRSTEPIIAAANALICHNPHRCIQRPEEQVCINSERRGQGGAPVRALQFTNIPSQAAWICQQIQSWIQQGTPAHDIAILSPRWQALSPIRALLEQVGIQTEALKNDSVPLVRNWLTYKVINKLQEAGVHRILGPEESVQVRLQQLFQRWRRRENGPTAQALLKIGRILDEERSFGVAEDIAAISADDVLTAIFEFNKTMTNTTQTHAVQVTSCHGAKGLEFRKVILLTDGFNSQSSGIEASRRLFYVAMTRAKEELVLCATRPNRFIEETGVRSEPIAGFDQTLPERMLYVDFTPEDVQLGHPATRQEQPMITQLQEGDPLLILPTQNQNGWTVRTPNRRIIGGLSRHAVESLRQQRIHPGQFQFETGEVTVRSIYRHLQMDDVTGEILEDWFVVIPQIRLCR